MNTSRRSFFSFFAQTAQSLSSVGSNNQTIKQSNNPPMTYRRSKGGEKISLLGYGSMRLPSVDGRHSNQFAPGGSAVGIDQEAVNDHIDYCLAQGVNLFDTAPAYCRGFSEAALGRALARHPRESYYVSTKMSNFAPAQWSAEASKAMYEASFKNLQTDYLDFYLLHNVGAGGFDTFSHRYIDNGMFDFLVSERKAGRIRNLGWSYHGDPRTVEWLIRQHDEGRFHWDFALIQMNFVDWRHAKEVDEKNLNAEYLYGELTRRGIPILVMEPLLGGRLAAYNETLASYMKAMDPEASQASWAMRFCGTHPNVLSILSGMTFKEHIEENVATFSPLKPLTEDELQMLEAAAEAYLGLNMIPCNRCNYCMPCPYGLDIPEILTFRNWVLDNRQMTKKQMLREYVRRIPDPLRRADHCIGCARCTPHCPQGFDVAREVQCVDEFVEGLK